MFLIIVIDWFPFSTYVIRISDISPGMGPILRLRSTAAEEKATSPISETPLQHSNSQKLVIRTFETTVELLNYLKDNKLPLCLAVHSHPIPLTMADSLDHLSSGRTRIEWLSSLNTEFAPKKNYRRTSIICTIGTHSISGPRPRNSLP